MEGHARSGNRKDKFVWNRYSKDLKLGDKLKTKDRHPCSSGRTTRMRHPAFINPQDTFKTVNPATEEVLATVQKAGKADIDKAVKAAREGTLNPATEERGFGNSPEGRKS